MVLLQHSAPWASSFTDFTRDVATRDTIEELMCLLAPMEQRTRIINCNAITAAEKVKEGTHHSEEMAVAMRRYMDFSLKDDAYRNA